MFIWFDQATNCYLPHILLSILLYIS